MADLERTLEDSSIPRFVSSDFAGRLSSSTKSAPIWSPRTPRWILQCLDCAHAIVPVEGGVYRVNRVVDETQSRALSRKTRDTVPSLTLRADHSQPDGTPVSRSVAVYDTFVLREITLQPIHAIVQLAHRVTTLLSNDHDQLQSQLDVASEYIYETIENLVFNHPVYGLLENAAPRMQFKVDGPASPDVLDELLALAWRRPDLFAMHPEALAAFRKSANRLSLTLEEVEIFGSSFTAWRGLPIVPTDKLHVFGDEVVNADTDGSRVAVRGTTSVLAMRLGPAKQGVICLCPERIESASRLPYINVQLMGINEEALSQYLLTTYTAMAVLSAGALARADVRL